MDSGFFPKDYTKVLEVWSYEAPEDKQDVFARKACPAFLTFRNAAYIAGVTVELPCLCKPLQVQSVIWFYRKYLGSAEETRALSDHHGSTLLDPSEVPNSGDLRSRFSIRLFSLLIFRAGVDDSGIYICGSTHQDFFYAYDLDIQEVHTLSFSPRLVINGTMKSGVEEQLLASSRSLYRLFTSFQPWSVCDRCGIPGEQVRVGLCYVQSNYLHVRYRRTNQTVASCGSGSVPSSFGPLKESGVGAKLEVRSCQVVCANPGPTDYNLQALLAFLGYSGSQSAEVPVSYLNHPADNTLVLGCPGARPNMAVAWDRGFEPLYRYEHSAGGNVSGSDSRLQIDAGHHLVFQPANIEDSGTYYCWLQGRRAAEIRLLVYPHFGGSLSVFSHPDFPEAIATVLKSYAVMTALFCLFLAGRIVMRLIADKAETHME